MSEENCLQKGSEVGDLLVRIREASKSGDDQLLRDSAAQLRTTLMGTSCVAPQLKEKVSNEVEALVSFAVNKDRAGVDQAVDMLRQDLGVSPIHEHLVRVKAATAPALPKLRTLGYRVTVDGVAELKFVPKRDSAEAFEAFSKLHPGQKVELVPIEGEQ